MNDSLLPCICGHLKTYHEINRIGYNNPTGVPKQWCSECWLFNQKNGINNLHDFKLDNLKYIEQLAKEKGLV